MGDELLDEVPPPTDAVLTAFRALESAGVRWSLLRGSGGTRRGGDIDVAVAPGHAGSARAILVAHGFVLERSWAARSQQFFVGRDDATGSYPLIHMCTRLAFGQWYALELPVEACLRRSQVHEGLRHLAARDEFWVSLLHCLLDKGAIGARHRERLRSLCDLAGSDDEMAADLGAKLLPDVDPATLLSHVRSEQWDALEELGAAVRNAWRRHDRAWRCRASMHAASLFSRRILEPVTARTPDVALLAPDGAGKSTVAAELTRSLPRPVRVVYLGAYGAGTPRSRVDLPAIDTIVRMSTLWWRWIIAQVHRSRRRFVIYDRHPIELTGRAQQPWRRRLRTVLLNSLPVPRVMCVIDVPAEVMHARKGEHSVQELEQQRRVYLDLAARDGRCVVVDGTQSVSAVADDVAAAIWRHRTERR